MHSNQKHLYLGIGITLSAYLFFAAASSLVWYFGGRFPTIQIIFIQNIISLLCILPLALYRGLEPLKTKELPTHMLRDFLGVVSYYLYFLAIRFLNLVDATILNYTAPFFVPLIWWILTKKRVENQVWFSIIIGFLGVAIILDPTKSIFKLGFVFGIFAGICSAGSMVVLRILNLKAEPMIRTLFYFFSIGSLLSFPFAWSVWIPPTAHEWVLASGIGVTTALGQIFLTVGYRYGCASYLSPLAYSIVIYNGLISYYIYQNPLTVRTFIGAALIVLGGSLTYLWKRKHVLEHPKKENPPL